MELKYDPQNKEFFCLASYDERELPKSKGFRWNPDKKRWWTNRKDIAANLRQYAKDDLTLTYLGNEIGGIEASRQTTSDIDLPRPNGLEYLPFQKAGIAYAMNRTGVIIGDEMGLGKTIEAIGVANATQASSLLILCPATPKLNWKKECEKWLIRKSEIYIVNNNDPIPETANVVIVNYDRLKNGILENILAREWDILIADECHFLKNPEAKRSQTVLGKYDKKKKEFLPGVAGKAKRKLFLTGTPIPNRPIELQGIAACCSPGLFGNRFKFGERYCALHHNGYGWDWNGASNLDELQNKLRNNIMIRRLKKDVLKDLPAKIRQIILLEADNKVKKLIKEQNKFIEENEDLVESIEAATELLKSDPDNENYKDAVDKLSSEMEIAFSEMSEIRKELAIAKIGSVVEHIETLLETTEKLVVFGHHHNMINSIANAFQDICVKIDGTTAQDKRMPLVDKFQNDPNCRLFVGSTLAAGTAITLTAASTIVFAELDWVPGNVSQAEDRCHRIGQSETVIIQHLVYDNSLDARMAKILIKKQAIADSALDKVKNISLPKEQAKSNIVKQKNNDKPILEVTEQDRIDALYVVQSLAAVCDGARREDFMGFNKFDAAFGLSLASKMHHSDKEVNIIRKMTVKYKRQLPAEIVERFGYKK